MANENGKLQQEPELSESNISHGICSNQNEVVQLTVSTPVQTDDTKIENNNSNSITDNTSCSLVTSTTTTKDEILTSTITSQIDSSCSSSFPRNQLTDPDVCFNGAHSNSDSGEAISLPIGFGDCTNIRATMGVLDFAEGFSNRRTDSNIESHFPTACGSNKSSSTVAAAAATATVTAPTQNSSTFSFKHFLSSSSCAFTAPSTTVTSLDPMCSVAATAAVAASSSSMNVTTTSTLNGSTQNSTGARPKVPQSISDGGDASTNAGSSNVGSTRMKRSPRFSSFDSQASLAEYTASGRNNNGGGDDFSLFSGTTTNSTGFRLYPHTGSVASPFSSAKRNFNSSTVASAQNTGFPSAPLGTDSTIDADSNCGGDIQDRQSHQQQQQMYVPRSYSNYDMPIPMPPPMSPLPRRRLVEAVANIAQSSTALASSQLEGAAAVPIPNRPNRLSLHTLNSTNSSKLKLDLPIDSEAANINAPSDFPPISAAALPDFVQDHWMDAFYLQDMHLSSPRSSPTRDFVKATASAVWRNIGSGAFGSASTDSRGAESTYPLDGPSTSAAAAAAHAAAQAAAAATATTTAAVAAAAPKSTSTAPQISNKNAAQIISGMSINESSTVTGNNHPNNNGGASKMLPDFLSDGPIIHSSQRLADIAAGLPSTSIGSPEDSAITSQMSKLTIEIDRLQHELCETRVALCEQTRRANELERQIQEETRRRAATSTAQQVLRLKQQLAELAEEAELLRRENEALRDNGAVGGCSDSAGNQRTESRYLRPAITRSQQISQALLRAASNAENNLRQLLTGVENLRRMAADIEDPTLRLDYDGNSDVFPDFADDYDGFEDFSGGPAL